MAGDPPAETDRGRSAALDALDSQRTTGRPVRALDPAETTCCECTKFGPWGDGEYRYCADHVPEDLYHADRAFKRRLERNK